MASSQTTTIQEDIAGSDTVTERSSVTLPKASSQISAEVEEAETTTELKRRESIHAARKISIDEQYDDEE
jgi:hypothetical protein